MHTATYVELAEKSNDRINELAVPRSTLEVARVDAAFGERLQLLQRASTSKQRLAYGAQRFAEHFVVMEELRLPTNEGVPWRNKREQYAAESALRQKVWKALPNNMFKRFQELFCEPRKFIVPRFTVESGTGRVHFRNADDALYSDLSPCLVSPDRISDELIQSLGIASFTPHEVRSPRARYLRKGDDVLEGIKARFECLVPLAPRDRRFLVLDKRKHDEALSEKYPSARPIPPGLHGTLILISEDTALSRRIELSEGAGLLQPLNAVNRRAAHFISAFDAARKTRHQRTTYDVEVAQIARLAGTLENLKVRLTTEWRAEASPAVKQGLLRELRTAGTAALTLFEHAVDRFKIAAEGRMQTARTGRDSLGRLNPTVTAVQLGKTIDFLHARLREITPKGGYNEQDRQLLEGRLAEQSQRISSAVHAIKVSPRGFADQFSRTCAALDQDLAQVTLQPLSTYAAALRLLMRHCTAEFNNAAAFRDGIAATQQVGTLFEGILCIERIKSNLVDAERIAPLYLKRQTLALRRVIRSASTQVQGALIPQEKKITAALAELQSIPSRHTKAQEEWCHELRKALNDGSGVASLAKLHPALDTAFTRTAVEPREERSPEGAAEMAAAK